MPFENWSEANEIYADFDHAISIEGATLIEATPDEIEQIIERLERLPQTWTAPWAGVPVGDSTLIFGRDGQHVASLGVGRRTLIAQGCGYFFIQSISETEEVFYRSYLERGRPEPKRGEPQ